MYDRGMMMKNTNGEDKMEMAKYIGFGFHGIRKDGRVFVGIVQDVRLVKDRTLVVIRQEDNSHKSFYMEDITGGWSCSLCNGQPMLLSK